MRGNKQRQMQEGWQAYLDAASQRDMEGLRGVAALYPRSEAGAWGFQSAGDLALATGSRSMFFDRGEAIELLKQARDDYESASNMATSDFLKQRSLLGLAQTQEALNEFDTAFETYEKLIKTWPESSLAETSRERLAFLNNPSTKEFYDWFMAQQPIVPQPNPLGGSNVRPPSPYADLPTDPDLQLPNMSDLENERAAALQAPETSSSSEAADPAAEITDESSILDVLDDDPSAEDAPK